MSDDQQSLPPYTYVPGMTPHPVSERLGHSRFEREECATPSLCFQLGLRLFNSGYYWEAHEAWEDAWKKLGRCGPAADRIKGLIKLAAAGVKCLEANPTGVIRHASRAIQLIETSSSACFQVLPELNRLDWQAVSELAHQLRRTPPVADPSCREQARTGGVPILGCLPMSRVSPQS